jgi:thiamine biosynthesis lipoprotein
MLIAPFPAPILTSVHRRAMRLMDIIFEISVVADDEIWANERIDNAFTEIARIEKLLANNDQQSQATLQI